VVLADNVYDFFAKMVLPGEFDSVFHVRDKNEAAHGGASFSWRFSHSNWFSIK